MRDSDQQAASHQHPRLKTFVQVAVDQQVYPTSQRLKRYVQILFRDVDVSGARVLDIGGGDGRWSFAAWALGARAVTCLEPCDDGGNPEHQEVYEAMSRALMCADTVQRCPLTLQAFEPDEAYDVVLMHASINHLDEQACSRLHNCPQARRTYTRILGRIWEICSPGAAVIIVDASRHNIAPQLGIRNPWASTIEWTKHQQPRVWAQALSWSGFRPDTVHWLAPTRLGPLGEHLMGNSLAAWLTTSLFRLRATRQ